MESHKESDMTQQLTLSLSPGDPPNPGMKHTSFASPALAGEFFTTELPGRSLNILYNYIN